MRNTIPSSQPDRIKTGFLLFPKTLPASRFSYDLETRWLERSSWVQAWTGERWPGQKNMSYYWKSVRWAGDEEISTTTERRA